jgi:hypothetical protein
MAAVKEGSEGVKLQASKMVFPAPFYLRVHLRGPKNPRERI